jgi:hypothetical protein
MLRRAILAMVVVLAAAVLAQTASADPTNAKGSLSVTAICGGQQVHVSVNGNGAFNAAHVVGSTATFVPTAFDLTASFTPAGGETESDTNTNAKQNQKGTVTCDIPEALNTFTFPDGSTFSLSGTVTGFFTPTNGR